jgi:hypothetical protein
MNPKTILIIVMLFMTSIVLVSTAAASTPSVSVNAPDNVNTDFDVVIEIENVVDLDSGQYDLHFDPDCVSVKSIDDGNINGIAIPIDNWVPVDNGTLRVLFNLPGITGVSGSGSLAVIHFNTIKPGECSMQISDGLLVDVTAGRIAANWDGIEDVPVQTTTTATAKENTAAKQPGFDVILCICVLVAVAFVLGKRDE